ncbi:MAG: hypothetical protein ACKO26_19915, partial [Planctomycetota bacterium]
MAAGTRAIPEGEIRPADGAIGSLAPAGVRLPAAEAMGGKLALPVNGVAATGGLSTGALGDPGMVSTGIGRFTISGEMGAGTMSGLESPADPVAGEAGRPAGGRP